MKMNESEVETYGYEWVSLVGFRTFGLQIRRVMSCQIEGKVFFGGNFVVRITEMFM